MEAKEIVAILAQSALFLVVASFGLQARARDVAMAFRQTGLIARGILAVNVVVPVTAIVMCSFLPIDPAVRIGIIIMAISPLAPLLTGKMLKGGLDASTAVAMYVALILVAMVLVPLTVQLLSAIYPGDATISAVAIAFLVAKSVFLPLAVGLALAAWAPSFARRAAPIASLVGMLAILLLVVLILYKTGGGIVGLIGDGSVAAMTVTVLAGVAAGHWLGRPDRANSNALALAAGMRHPGIALMIANQNFSDSRVKLAIVLFLLVSVVVTTVYQAWLRRTASRGEGESATA